VYSFVAVILVCLNSVAPEACDETTAADLLSNGVERPERPDSDTHLGENA
jgi:hypothetical protein